MVPVFRQFVIGSSDVGDDGFATFRGHFVDCSSCLGEGVAGALFLFSGAIFPLEVLPAFLRPIGYAMPVTYWLELLRRALVGSVAEAFPTLVGFNNNQLLGILIGLTIAFGILSILVFRWCDYQARERGLIDIVTNY